jgi:probable F420-dependent oxidoreductase
VITVSPPHGQGLSVRVGVGWNPLHRDSVGRPVFWQTVELLEELAYDSLWMSDTATRAGPAPLPVLAAVAARTERLKLGTSVLVVPARNPVLLAKELATIDLISGGRLFPAFGIGRALPVELSALGVPREERVARLEECVHIVGALWAGEPVTYRGRFNTLEGVTLTPLPTRPRIELWLGGSTAAAVRRIGRLAHGWLASSISPAAFGELVGVLRDEAAAHDRVVPEDHFGTVLFVAESEDQARDLLRAQRRGGRAIASETVAVGIDGTRSLLHSFRTAGATKFVLYPLAADPRTMLGELKREVIDPFEAEPVFRPRRCGSTG